MLLTLKSASAAVPPAVLTVTAHVPDTPEGFLPFGCVHLSPEEAGLFHVKLSQWETARHASFPAVLILIGGNDWERDFTPWPAPKVFKGGRDFTGGADPYLSALTQDVLPAAEREIRAASGLQPSRRFLAGYSLAGLFALYAMYQTALFDGCVCASGSLWYPGFREFALSRPVPAQLKQAAFSLGDKEKDTRNAVMASVEETMRAIEIRLREAGGATAFDVNPGGHFKDTGARLFQGLCRLCAVPET